MKSPAEKLLLRWAEGLLALRVRGTGNKALDGNFLCPACGALHGRAADAVWPLVWLWARTGEGRWLDAAKAVVSWALANSECPAGSGGFIYDPNTLWRGTTAFLQAALGKTLIRFGDRLDDATRRKWRGAFDRQTAWLHRWIDNPDLVVNVNYRAGCALSMELAYALDGDPRHRASGDREARRVLGCIGADGLLFGEAKPLEAVSPRGCRGVDIGYNMEETLPAMFEWADLRGASAEDRSELLRCGAVHLSLILPDGGMDNSFGSRAYKWTYWGSRTSAGPLPLHAALAKAGVPGAARTAARTIALYERCTDPATGLLSGGPDAIAADEPVCVHHAFCHAKTLPDFIEAEEAGFPEAAKAPAAPPPRLVRFSSTEVALANAGPWRATASANDSYFVDDDGKSAGGGSLTLLHHRELGPVFAASMAEWSLVELGNMQEQRHDDVTRCFTPRLETPDGRFKSVHDHAVAFSAEEDAEGAVVFRASGTLRDRDGEAPPTGGGFSLEWRIAPEDVRVEARTDGEAALVLPVLARPEDAVETDGCAARVRKATGTLELSASRPFVRVSTKRADDLAFSPQTGFLAAVLALPVAAGATVRGALRVARKAALTCALLPVLSLFALCATAANLPPGVVVERERDSVDRAEIDRWYDYKDTDPGRIARREYTKCEGTLFYAVEVPETGWYELWQSGFEPAWNRSWLVDGRPVAERFTSKQGEEAKALGWANWRKELNLFLAAGRHEIGFARRSFPGGFPRAWRLARPGAADRPEARGGVRAHLPEGVVRAGEEFALVVEGGGPGGASEATLVATCDHRADEPVPLGTVTFPASGRPVAQTLRCRVPREGVYAIRLLDEAGFSCVGDCAAGALVVVETKAPPPGASLDTECVIDIDCAATPPLAEVAGATRVVRSPAGAYRESSGSAPQEHWALDGFSYRLTLPDDRSTYLLAVDYPDDAFRSVGFWINDGAKGNTEGRDLTGGIETGGQYSLSGGMLRHEAFFWPRGTNCVFAAVNLNRGSRAAASRIRVYRVAGPLPAAPAGIRRGRLAGTFFEENGRWKRHFGMGHAPEAIRSDVFENLKSMERWGEWMRFTGENLMNPSVLAYATAQYPSRVVSGFGVSAVNEVRMLAFVAEKYGCKLLPHITLHDDLAFNIRMGITVEKSVGPGGKVVETPRFADPDVVEWARNGTTAIPWRKWSYNPLHPKVQDYMVAIVDELAGMLSDSPAFAGISLRVPLSWQFSGVAGLNHGDYGYGDFTMRLFESETGIKVPDGEGGDKRFAARFAFLDSPEMRPQWIAWRTKKMKDYYGRLLAAIRRHRPDAQLHVMFWPTGSRALNGRVKTLAEQMEECGVAPEAWRDVEGVSFCGMQFSQGRRYFTPRYSSAQYHRLFDKDVLGMSADGQRAVCIYTDYYEVNTNLDWKKYGAESDGMAFDCCVPGGDAEMEAWSVPLAEADPGVYANGGNGWMFGTPRLRAPWLREYLALPPGRFAPLPGVADCAVAFRAYEGPEGRFLYAVNVTDRPARVRIDCGADARLLGAADGRPTKGDFTLAPFALRAFEIAGGGEVRPTAEADPALRARHVGALPFLNALLDGFRDGHCGADMPQDFAGGIEDCVSRAAAAFTDGRWLDFRAALYDPRLAFLLDLAGEFPPGWWEGGTGGTFGGYPPNAPSMPALALHGIFDDTRPAPRNPLPPAFTEMPTGSLDARRTQHLLSPSFWSQGKSPPRECRAGNGAVFAVDPSAHRISATGPDGRLLWERRDKGAQCHRLGDVPLVAPAGCALDGAGRLWVSDEGADRILCFEAATGAFIGRFGHSGTRTGAGFRRPRDLAVEGNILRVEDLGNQRTVEFEIGN